MNVGTGGITAVVGALLETPPVPSSPSPGCWWQGGDSCQPRDQADHAAHGLALGDDQVKCCARMDKGLRCLCPHQRRQSASAAGIQ